MERFAAGLFGVTGVMLVVALLPMEYSYYVLLRGVVTVASVLLAIIAFRTSKFAWILLAIPSFILWFPPFGIEMTKEMWGPIDLVIGLLFVLACFKFLDSTKVELDQELG